MTAICICPRCHKEKWCYAAREQGEPEPMCHLCKREIEKDGKS